MKVLFQQYTTVGMRLGRNVILRPFDTLRINSESAGLTIVKRWRDLHVLSISWITRGPWYFWPLSWQYQVYYHCSLKK